MATSTCSPALARRAGALVRVATVVAAALLFGLAGAGPADAAPSLSVTPRDGLSPTGATTVTVKGSGYDTNKGIYVAFCVVPPAGQAPSPCGGGVDMDGSSGGSEWFSNDPPPYGEGLAKPYGPNGSFTTTVQVTPTIGDIDCTTTRCAVVTRNDHTRNSDRSQDVIVPVSFKDPEPEPTKDPEPTPTKRPDPAPTEDPKPSPKPSIEPSSPSTPSSTPTTSSSGRTTGGGNGADGSSADGEDATGTAADASEGATADGSEDEVEETEDEAIDDGADDDGTARDDVGTDDDVDSDVDDTVVAVGSPDDGSSGGAAVWVAAGSVVAIGAGVGTFLIRRRRAAAP